MNEIFCDDCIDTLKKMDSESINCVITSPPYYGLRDYGTATWEGGDEECNHNPQKPDGGDRSDRTLPLGRGGIYKDTCIKCGAIRIDKQIGLESTPEDYVSKMVAIFREIRRVLKDDGTVWLNLGDSYWGSGKGSGQDEFTKNLGRETLEYGGQIKNHSLQKHDFLKPKDLIGIPWRVAFALQADGWWLRQDIIWHKPNPMPESVTDRCTKAHEYIFLLTKSAKYFYDAEAITEKANYDGRQDEIMKGSVKYQNRYFPTGDIQTLALRGHKRWNKDEEGNRIRNKRSVWTVTTKPFKEAHFATFPEDLIKPCVLAGCPENGVIYDPFMGAGTTAFVAFKYHRNFIGSEINPEYVKMANKRIAEMLQQYKLEL